MLKLLGSKFFQEVQTGNKPATNRTKTYDVNAVFDDDTSWGPHDEDFAYVGESWDDLDSAYDEGDADSLVCMQFEESIVEALQGDSEIAACYNAYLDARKRLTDRNRNRGFWNSSKGNQSNPKGKGKGKGKMNMRYRKPLSQRILESECRRCGVKGHWKAECPLNRSSQTSGTSSTKESGAFTGMTMVVEHESETEDMIPHELPETATCFCRDVGSPEVECFVMVPDTHGSVSQGLIPSVSALGRMVQNLKQHLSPQPRKTHEPHTCKSMSIQDGSCETTLFVSHGPYGIVDLGASQTVIGEQQVAELLENLPSDIRARVREVPCQTVFRFGNSSTVMCIRALLVPLAKWDVKICIVKSRTPFLISNNVFRTLGAQIDTATDHIHFSNLNIQMSLRLSEKKLYLLDFCELIRIGNQACQVSRSEFTSSVPVMSSIVEGEEPKIVHEGPQPEVQQGVLSSPRPCTVPASRVCVSESSSNGFSGRSFPDGSDSEEARRIPGHVVRAAVSDADSIRRGKGESDFHPCDQGRPEVCSLVPQEVLRQQESGSPTVSVLHSTVCGTHGAPSGSRPGDASDGSPADSPQAQVKSDASPTGRCSQPGELVGIGARQAVEPDPRGELSDARRTECPARTDLQHGKFIGSDHPAAADIDPAGHARGCPQEFLEGIEMNSELISRVCDAIGSNAILNEPEHVIDHAYFSQTKHEDVGNDNWVYEEMWNYFGKKHSHMNPATVQSHWKKSYCDVLEVYCSDTSQLTHQGELLGMSTRRFGLRQGDLSTFGGRCKLYDALWILRPKHIWLSPRCGPWSAWNRLNSQKSQRLARQISSDRKSENVHLLLCTAMFQLQDWRGDTFHAHLEQPNGSEMLAQRELEYVVVNAFRAVCDMCTAGNLRHPNSQELLRKRTQVWTTSKIMYHMLLQFQCPGSHPHDVIAGSCRPHGSKRMSLTKYTELYTAMFGRRLCKALQCSIQIQERTGSPQNDHAEIANPAVHDEPLPKRRRLWGKFQPERLFEPIPTDGASNAMPSSHAGDDPLRPIRQLLQMAEQCAPRVGKAVLQEGPLFEGVQQLYPDKQIVAVEVCRGINRLRVCPIGQKGTAPYRRSFGKRRNDLQPFVDDQWEHWEQLSHRQQICAGVPSRILVSVFATNKRPGDSVPEMPPKRGKNNEEGIEGVDSGPIGIQNHNPTKVDSDASPKSESRHPREDPLSSMEASHPDSLQKPLELKSHGPKFLALPNDRQSQIKKIHQNLGHPDNRTLQMALKNQGWSDMEVKACTDFVCPVCYEKQRPKIARPGQLRSPKDFNDHVSFDAAEWQDNQGQKYGFYHFIDSATNFHIAVPYQQQTTEGLIDAFNMAWIRWAGPPKSVMFDSATEANSERFSKFLQEHGINSYSPDSWQAIGVLTSQRWGPPVANF